MANSKETIDDSQMAMNIYDPNSKVLEVIFQCSKWATLSTGDTDHDAAPDYPRRIRG